MSTPEDADVLAALDRQSSSLVEYAFDVFLEFDFNDHSILGGALTGGHVATYLARQADVMADDLIAAAGHVVPEPDRARRWELSENGNLRPGAVLVEDVRVSAERLEDAIAAVPSWDALSEDDRRIPARRLLQILVHLADLGRPWDAVDERDARAAVGVLPEVWGTDLAPYRLTVTADDSAPSWSTQGDVTTVSGPPRALLAWASGRDHSITLPSGMPRPPARTWI